jgi:flagellar hook-length control protein FliK
MMIQQINRIPLPKQAQAAHPKQDTTGFQALLNKIAGKPTGSDASQNCAADPKVKDEKDSDCTAAADTTATASNAAVFAAMLQQISGSQQPMPAQSQIGGLQLPALQAVQAPGKTAGSLLGIQEMNPLTATPGVQMNITDSSAQQGTTTIAPVNNSSVQQPEASIPTLAQGDTKPQAVQNAPVPAQTQTKTEQTIAFAQTEFTQAASSQPKPTNQMNRSVPEISQAVVQTPKADSASQFISKEQPQPVIATEEKTQVPIPAAAGQEQSATGFTDLFQTGNVVIKVSDQASNTAKAVCNQVADKVAVNYKAGIPAFEMELHPKNLGKVSVKLAMQNGCLTVEISALSPKTQSMLMANSDEIKSMLQSTVSQPVRVLEPAQDKQWYQQEQSNQSPTQQQQEKQQQQNAKTYRNPLDSNVTTDDFLAVMRLLRPQSFSA